MEFFKNIYTMLNKAKNLNKGFSLKFVIDEQVQDEIIRLNTRDQLYDKGIDSLNATLGEYTPYTIEIKQRKGQKTSNITLFDEGDFYESFDVIVYKDSIVIDADTIKEDTDLAQEFGIDILGLTDENWEKIKREYIAENYHDYVLKALFQ